MVGLQLFWQETSKSPSMEWEKWIDLFAVAMMAKYPIAMSELTRSVDETNPRVKSLLGDRPEEETEQYIEKTFF